MRGITVGALVAMLTTSFRIPDNVLGFGDGGLEPCRFSIKVPLLRIVELYTVENHSVFFSYVLLTELNIASFRFRV
jgi:hypothetical protein